MNSSKQHNRKSACLQAHDYRTPGGYYITICTFHKQPLFGKIEQGDFIPTPIGKIVQHQWFQIPAHRPQVFLHQDEFIIMPDHIHAIVWIDELEPEIINSGPKRRGLQSNSLGAIIGQFKSKTSRMINGLRNSPGNTIWQRNYYDHIIRSDRDLAFIRKYILDNPDRWVEENSRGFVENYFKGDSESRPYDEIS